MADDKSSDPRDAKDRPQDPLVERLRPDPAQPAEPTKTLSGLLGDSDRPGNRRLYFTAELDYYAEFRVEDVVAYADIAPTSRRSSASRRRGSRCARDAPVEFTRAHHARALDEFDLDVRLAPRLPVPPEPNTFGCPDTEFFGCTQFCTQEAICPGRRTTGARCPPAGARRSRSRSAAAPRAWTRATRGRRSATTRPA